MTEPSDEAMNLASRLRRIGDGSSWQAVWFKLNQQEAAREIDALAEKRVAAALEPWEQLRWTCAEILGCDTDWPQHGNAPLAIASALQLRVKWPREPAGRLAPEGAALTDLVGDPLKRYGSADLARPRCSTQEDTGSVSGERERGFYWVLCHTDWEIGYYDPPGRWQVGESSLAGCDELFQQVGPRIVPPTDAGGPGSASNTESSPTPTVECDHHWIGGNDGLWCTKCKAELSNSTGAVAAPGPTVGDVERARTVMNEADHQIETWKDVPGVVVGRSTYINRIAAALSAERASAREELLAQIREPSKEFLHDVSPSYGALDLQYARDFMRRLADKLTEAK